MYETSKLREPIETTAEGHKLQSFQPWQQSSRVAGTYFLITSKLEKFQRSRSQRKVVSNRGSET